MLVSVGFAVPANAGKLRPEFRVNTETGGDQEAPAVAKLANGDFVIVWKNFGQSGNLGGMYFQRYNAGGTKLGEETRVNSNATSVQHAPAMAALENGGFVVVAWNSDNEDHDLYGIFARRYNSGGGAAGLAFRANSETDNNQFGAAVTALSNGRFIIAWHSLSQDGSGWGVYAQRFKADSSPAGDEFRANVSTAGDQLNPAIAKLSGGGFVIVWDAANKDGSGKAVVARRFNADGTPDGGEFRVNSFTGNDQMTPAIAALGNDRYVVTWVSVNQDAPAMGSMPSASAHNRDPRHDRGRISRSVRK